MAARTPRYVVGIDLGTTHCAVAYAPTEGGVIADFPVPQLVSPGETAAQALLPSFLYLPAEGELPAGAGRLPWGEAPEVVGELARRLGAKVPGRLVSSAKSWLSHAGVDRTAALLPWGAPEEVPRVSPVEASSRYLAHLRQAWDAAHPDAPLAAQEVILTVPASFDEVARELTVQAAAAAGLASPRLLEEPQAAFYDLLNQHDGRLGAEGEGVRLALVVDVGGGTTDLTLVRVEAQDEGPPRLERVAVGDHLVLGGDNMDLALAHHLEPRLAGGSRRLDAADWSALVQAARLAKETLLSGGAPERYGVALPGRGARLVGGGRQTALGREEALALLLDGFFPRSAPDEAPKRRSRTALTELGLPYAADPAISRHVAAFLRRHAPSAAEAGVPIADGLPRPDALLLNGGVFNADAVAARLVEVASAWFPGFDPVPLLRHGSLDLAVARGAAYYGLVRRGFGVRIAGGSARAYYIGVEDAGGGRKAFCVAPRGMEEGSEAQVPRRTFQLLLGRPVTFPLYTSTGERGDALGSLSDLDDDLEPLPPLHTVLRTEHGEEGTAEVRVRSGLTELGTLELALVTPGRARRQWRLAFSIRGEEAGGGAQVAPIDELPRRFDEAKALLERIYGTQAQRVEPREVKGLWKGLEQIIGPRDEWSSAVGRELFSVVLGGAKKRRRTADHERIWFQLAGFCLRPGFGAPLDAWRVDELWKVFDQGVQYTTDKPNWSEWWILWRRVSGGLDAERQRRLLHAVRPWLEPPKSRVPRKPKGPQAHGHDEMVRMLASLERLSAQEKVEAGRWILHRQQETPNRSWWPLGRLGARQPFYGSAHDVVPAPVAAEWIEGLLALDWRKADAADFAAAQIARFTGDRQRDLPAELREAVAARLEARDAHPDWVRMVREVVRLSTQDETRVFGDTLPAGLKLA